MKPLLTEKDFIESGDLTKSDTWKIDKLMVYRILTMQEELVKYKTLYKIAADHIVVINDNYGHNVTNPLYVDDLKKKMKELDNE